MAFWDVVYVAECKLVNYTYDHSVDQSVMLIAYVHVFGPENA